MKHPMTHQEMSPDDTRVSAEFEERTVSALRLRDIAIFAAVFAVGIATSWVFLSRPQNSVAVEHQTAAVSSATTSSKVDQFASLGLIARSAIVVDLATGRTLYAQHPDVQLPLASLTKVPMAFVVNEALPPNTVITIPQDTSPPGSVQHLGKNEKWKLQDVVSFTLIASSNSGADILANAADENIRMKYPQAPAGGATVWRMNAFAKELGLADTYFVNPSGLDVSTAQAGAYGSARSMAKLFAYVASTSPQVFAGTTRNKMQFTSLDGHKTTAINTDEALDEIPGVIMGKTGYTELAGGNLVVVFEVGPSHPVVVAVMHSTEKGRFEDMKKLVAATIRTVTNAPAVSTEANNAVQ